MRAIAAVVMLCTCSPAVAVLASIDSPDALVRRLHSPDSRTRDAAPREFEGLDRPAQEQVTARIVQAVRRQEHRPGEVPPGTVLLMLGAPAVPGVGALLAEPDPDVRVGAVRLLGMIAQRRTPPGPWAEIEPILEQALGDPHRAVVLTAVQMLSDRRVRVARPALERLLAQPDSLIRSAAARALVISDPDRSGGAIPVLVGDLQDPNEHTRAAAAQSLGFLGVRARGAVPALAAALQDEDYGVRVSAADALTSIDPDVPGIVPTLVVALGGPNVGVRAAAGHALERLGPRAAAAVPALIRALGDPEDNVMAVAVFALGSIGPAAQAAVPALEQAAKSSDPYLRVFAQDALRRIRGR